ncbi:ABC transporter permease subunit [Microbacterium sp.]|uniref:ABC transporter permease subunit n=1 Tax=Microbacterium sp. TaxID=51671 RepID=UPI003341D919
MTVQTAPATARTTRVESPYTLTFFRSLRSEWIKLSTLRSTWWAIAITAVLTIGIAMLAAMSLSDSPVKGLQIVVMPIQFTMLLAGILGVIAVTGEYSTGMIRSTLAADPVRGGVLAAKAVVLALFMFLASFVIFTVAAVVVSPILMGKPGEIDWTDLGGTFAPILAASFSMAVFALIGVAFGFVLRSGAGAIAATVGVLFVLPIVTSMFAMAGEAWRWILDASHYLPMSASQVITTSPMNGGDGGEILTAYLTLGGWIVAGMLAAWAVLRTRDA